jgi:(E)-4-hydroxy-3-methylbut-2-enyl-diphosphate synthase
MSKPQNICAERRPTRCIVLRDPRGVETAIGDGAPIRVQSMTTTVTGDLTATAAQVMELASAGAELVRVTVNDDAAADVLPDLVKMSNVPIVADIHYQHDLALRSIEAGIAKLRINPGNIGSRDKVELVVKAARDAGVPIRVGVNKGSLHRRYEEMAVTDPAGAMVQSAVDELEVFEKLNYSDVLVSLKSSEPMEVVEACRRFAKLSDVPQHLGVTEAGTLAAGIARSATAMGVLLSEGIGDTVRISLADDPVHEVNAAFHMLQALGLREGKARVVACPTCGRVEVDIVALATKVEELAKDLPGDRVISVLGCIVNGPGEAKAADLGIAAGRTKVAIYRKGELVRQVSKEELDVVLAEEIELLR